MKNMKVILSSDFGSLADIWVKLNTDDIEWFNTLVVEEYDGSLDIDGSEISIYLPSEDNLFSLRSHFNNLAA